MKWVKKNGTCNFDNNLLLLCRWRKGLSVANIVFIHLPFWVQVWGQPFELMLEETSKDIGNKIGNYVETDKRSWQSDQAKFLQIRVDFQIDKPFQHGGYIMNMDKERYGPPLNMRDSQLSAMFVEGWAMMIGTAHRH